MLYIIYVIIWPLHGRRRPKICYSLRTIELIRRECNCYLKTVITNRCREIPCSLTVPGSTPRSFNFLAASEIAASGCNDNARLTTRSSRKLALDSRVLVSSASFWSRRWIGGNAMNDQQCTRSCCSTLERNHVLNVISTSCRRQSSAQCQWCTNTTIPSVPWGASHYCWARPFGGLMCLINNNLRKVTQTICCCSPSFELTIN